MRVSDSMFYLSSKQNLAHARERLADAQNRATTGKAVSNSSDDPVAYAQAQKETIRANRAERYERTVNIAALALQVADDALARVTETLRTVQEVALQAATDTVSEEMRTNMANEVGALRDQILSLANSQSQGRFVFGGYIDNAQPFDADGQYHGHPEAQKVEVAPDVKLPNGMTGNQVFGSDGGQDVFVALDALQTALEDNDVDAVSASIGMINAAYGQIVESRSEIGVYIESCEVAESVTQQVQTRALNNRSELAEADVFDAYSALARAQQALDAALSIASAIPSNGLVQG